MASPYFSSIKTAKQRAYLDNLTKGLSRTEAKRLAGYSETTKPGQIETPQLKAQFGRLIRQHVPAHVLARRIAEGLEAKETKFFQSEGVVTDSRDVIAWGERRAYAEMAAKFGGYVDQHDSGAPLMEVNVTIEHIGKPAYKAPAKAE